VAVADLGAPSDAWARSLRIISGRLFELPVGTAMGRQQSSLMTNRKLTGLYADTPRMHDLAGQQDALRRIRGVPCVILARTRAGAA